MFGDTKKHTAFLMIFSVLMSNCSYSAHQADTVKDVLRPFHEWQAAFNAKDNKRVCDLFSKDLTWVTVYPGYAKENQTNKALPEKNFEQICTGLKRTINDTNYQHRYTSEIKDVVMSGDLAVVSVVWTLHTYSVASKKTTIVKEISIDIMKKQPNDHTWKMIRFMAYEVPINTL